MDKLERTRRWAEMQRSTNRHQKSSRTTNRRASTGTTGAVRSLSFPNQSPAAAALAMTQNGFYHSGDGLSSQPSIRYVYIYM